jgi:ParB family chromosome partitioning protein
VKKSGIIQPIIVRKAENGYEIIAGERRWRAAQAAGLKEIPVVIRSAEDRDVAELSLIENIQREALNPIEEANAYQTLMTRFFLSQEEISARVGKDRSTVANTIRLLKLPEALKKALIGKAITAGHALLRRTDRRWAVPEKAHRSDTERLINQKARRQIRPSTAGGASSCCWRPFRSRG